MRKFSGAKAFLVISAMLPALAAGCASTNWEEVAEQRNRELLDKDSAMQLAASEQAKEAARAEAAMSQKAAMEKENERLRRDAALAAQSAAEWERRVAELKSAQAPVVAAAPAAPAAPSVDAAVLRRLEELERQLKGNPAIDKVGLDTDGNIEISLKSDVSFASGSSAVTDKAKKSLKGLGDELNGMFRPYMVRVEGHTDAQPLNRTKKQFEDNLGLGSARALEVTRFLRDELKVDASRLMSASRGESEPVAPNDTAANRAKNRRVDIVVVIPRETAAAEAK